MTLRSSLIPHLNPNSGQVSAPAANPAYGGPADHSREAVRRIARESITSQESGGSADEEALYQRFKSRLMADAPAMIRLLTSQPEINVELERHVITMDGATVLGRLTGLVAKGFLNETRRFNETLRELERTGPRLNNKTLSVAFKELVAKGFLTKEGDDGYRAVAGMKVNIVSKKTA